MNNKKMIVLGLVGLISSVASNAEAKLNETPIMFAAVNFSEVNITEPNARPKKKSKPRSIKRKSEKSEIKQYEIEGYINETYVRVVLEQENDNYVVGNMYDKSGKETYIHGEYVDGALHVYDRKGTHFTIVVDEKRP